MYESGFPVLHGLTEYKTQLVVARDHLGNKTGVLKENLNRFLR